MRDKFLKSLRQSYFPTSARGARTAGLSDALSGATVCGSVLRYTPHASREEKGTLRVSTRLQPRRSVGFTPLAVGFRNLRSLPPGFIAINITPYRPPSSLAPISRPPATCPRRTHAPTTLVHSYVYLTIRCTLSGTPLDHRPPLLHTKPPQAYRLYFQFDTDTKTTPLFPAHPETRGGPEKNRRPLGRPSLDTGRGGDGDVRWRRLRGRRGSFRRRIGR